MPTTRSPPPETAERFADEEHSEILEPGGQSLMDEKAKAIARYKLQKQKAKENLTKARTNPKMTKEKLDKLKFQYKNALDELSNYGCKITSHEWEEGSQSYYDALDSLENNANIENQEDTQSVDLVSIGSHSNQDCESVDNNDSRGIMRSAKQFVVEAYGASSSVLPELIENRIKFNKAFNSVQPYGVLYPCEEYEDFYINYFEVIASLNTDVEHAHNNNTSGQRHNMYKCPLYKKLNTFERVKSLKRCNMCTNCLRLHPGKPCRSSGTCKICHQRHHTTLHHKKQINSSKQNKPLSNSKVKSPTDNSSQSESRSKGPKKYKSKPLSPSASLKCKNKTPSEQSSPRESPPMITPRFTGFTVLATSATKPTIYDSSMQQPVFTAPRLPETNTEQPIVEPEPMITQQPLHTNQHHLAFSHSSQGRQYKVNPYHQQANPYSNSYAWVPIPLAALSGFHVGQCLNCQPWFGQPSYHTKNPFPNYVQTHANPSSTSRSC